MTMRDDLRTALESQQSALGDVGDARQRLMHGAMLNRDQPAKRTWQWAAAVAAVLIAAIVITTFALVKAGGRTTPVPVATPSPHLQASPTPLTNGLVVPPGTAVILFHDPANFDQVDGVTWDGKTSGRVGVGATSGGNAAPDGSHYQTLGDKGADLPFWADDSTHYCALVRTKSRDVTAPGMLQIGAAGQAPRNVVKVGTFGAANLNAGGPTVVACSPAGDRAVVYQSGGQGIGVAEFWVIQLSTGRTIWHGGSGGWIAASHDGRYVALSGQGGAVIYGPDGESLFHPASQVYAFSWDGDFAVVAGADGAPRIIYWISGELTIWSCPPGIGYQYWQAFPEPGGTRIAIGALDPAYKNTDGFQPVDLFVVDTNGVTGFEKKDVTLFGQ